MTIQKLREHGTYIGFCTLRKAYIYATKNNAYAVNGKGVTKL